MTIALIRSDRYMQVSAPMTEAVDASLIARALMAYGIECRLDLWTPGAKPYPWHQFARGHGVAA